MVAPIYSNRKGIYKDLYRQIDSDNKKKEESQHKNSPRGIYVELYRQIQFTDTELNTSQKNLYALAFKKFFNDISANLSYFFTSVNSEAKMIILAFMVAKKPVNSYIENNLAAYQIKGNYYNDR